MTLVSFVLGMTLDTNYDPRAGVAERPICEQGPFHSAHAMMILLICSCNCYSQNMLFKGHPFRCEVGPKSLHKRATQFLHVPCPLVWLFWVILTSYTYIILLRVYTALSPSILLFTNAKTDKSVILWKPFKFWAFVFSSSIHSIIKY